MKKLNQLLFVLFLAVHSSNGFTEDIRQWKVNSWSEPFNYQSQITPIEYTPASRASKPWHLCISYPHLKDAYWLNVNYGMVEEAKRLGAKFTLVEAGGYPNIERQRQQIMQCTKSGADALILGTVSFDDLTKTISEIATEIPVLATVNDINDSGIIAKTGVSWVEMGRVTGEYIAQRHPQGGPPVRVAWFPGPKGAGWVKFIEQGFRQGIKDGEIEIVVTKSGDTGKEIQRTLVQEALEAYQNIDYIVGNALMAEAAISVLRQMNLENQTNIVSTYFTPAVYRGIKRNRILAAPTDAPVLQGRLSINQAIKILENKPFFKHLGPEIKLIDRFNFKTISMEDSLAPSPFLPTFFVK
ncbi:MAG: TMAO reductase system periplasmic protein TorT [Gammaproteobacteria bacterium]|nr:TMAO reductase system periplasmic protein TorT [Gammaproteobacteria bacterium]